MWNRSDYELPKETRMPTNIIGKHPKLRSTMQNNLKMFRVNHLALQIESNRCL